VYLGIHHRNSAGLAFFHAFAGGGGYRGTSLISNSTAPSRTAIEP